MSAADKRIDELLVRWLASVELHASYLELDDTAYAKVQDWPRHQRPNRWILELARTRLGELRRQVSDRRAKGDTAFAESLELMGFLTTLLGSEHVERFIPQAGPTSSEPARDVIAPTVETRRPAVEPAAIRARSAKPAAGPAKASPDQRKPVAVQAKPPKTPRPEKPPRPDKTATIVIADAVRLLSWGREWPQLASLISRLADRPPEPEVWAILRTHRAAIQAKARSIPE